MKKINYVLMMFVASVFLFSCEDQADDLVSGNYTDGQLLANLTTPTTGSYLRGITESIDMELELFTNPGATVSGITIKGQLIAGDDDSGVVTLATGESEGTVSFSSSELFNTLTVNGQTLNEDELLPGDRFVFTYELTMADGQVLSIASSYVVTFTCPSELEGTYMNTTEVSVSDFGPQSFAYEVELVALGDGRYQIEDMTGGLWSLDPYFAAYGTSARQTVLTEVCGSITVADAPDQFGGFITTEGRPAPTYDSETGVITWSWVDTIYGETGVTTYTPVE